MNPRAQAALIVYQVAIEHRSLSDCLSKIKTKTRDHSLIQALSYGVCRWYFRLDAIASKLLTKPLQKKDQDVYALVLIGIYQLIYLRVPDYAAVSDTVAAVTDLKKIWAKNLVNAVLRNYQRQHVELCKAADEEVSIASSHPSWLFECVRNAWPNDWEKILAANNQNPPMSLRVNTRKISRENYQKKLAEKNFATEIIAATDAGLQLHQPIDVDSLPGFHKGEVSVQDGAAQLAAGLLLLQPDQRVLDACAAPGGKAAHILEMQPDIAELVAVEIDAERLQLMTTGTQRLGLHVTSICADVMQCETWWDQKLFDRILLDAPCSATGVIRRHPDIKLLRRASDIKLLSQQQTQLFDTLWRLLKPGGIFLYATCSILPEENEYVVQQFLKDHHDAREIPIEASWGIAMTVGKQILPGMTEMDGFYYARLEKIRN